MARSRNLGSVFDGSRSLGFVVFSFRFVFRKIFFKSRTLILKIGSRRLAKSRNYLCHCIPLYKCGVADECKQYQKKIETTVNTDKSHNGTQNNSSMIAVTRIIVSATPRNEHRHKSANFSRSPGTGAGERTQKLFFFYGGAPTRDPSPYITVLYTIFDRKVPLPSTFTYNHGQKFLGQ